MAPTDLNLFAALANVSEYGIDALLVDGSQSLRRHLQANPAVFAFNPETMFVQVRVKDALGLVVSV
jgi:hypothetical protein